MPVLITVLLILIAAGSSLAVDDQQAEAAHYADMVCQGAWPDYKGVKPSCKEGVKPSCKD